MLRALTAIYVPLMGITLVYTGEHYVIDIFLGWIYAVAVWFAVVWAERAWARRRKRRAPATAQEPVAEDEGRFRPSEPAPQPVTYSSSE